MPARKYNDDIVDVICAALSSGLSMSDATRRAGVAPSTAKEWLAAGRRAPTGAFGSYATRVDASRAQARAARDRAREAASAEPMSRQELLAAASAAARRGSVRALTVVDRLLRADARNGSMTVEVEGGSDPSSATLEHLDAVASWRRDHDPRSLPPSGWHA